MNFSLEDYDFPLPEELIAKYPAEKRDASRLLVVSRGSDTFQDLPEFRGIRSFLREGDTLVYNETRVSQRRVFLRSPSGNRLHESIFLQPLDSQDQKWLCILKNRAKLRERDQLTLQWSEEEIFFTYLEDQAELVVLQSSRPLQESDFETWGSVPIPPYLKRSAEPIDKERYQTIFAKTAGSVAAPTAGLHFTEDLKTELQSSGISFVPVLLQVGYGTFRPLEESQIQSRTLHEEEYVVSGDTSEKLNRARKEGRRIFAIGTTSLRVLETVYSPKTKTYASGRAGTSLFLQPGDTIHSIDGLVTNFHLPKSSLLLLVSAFLGKEKTLAAYSHAIQAKYRFFSYGDAMLLL